MGKERHSGLYRDGVRVEGIPSVDPSKSSPSRRVPETCFSDFSKNPGSRAVGPRRGQNPICQGTRLH